jgi:membrane protein YdbS with pleckstrin-like domain
MADAAESNVVQKLRLQPDEHILVALQPSGWPVVPNYIFSIGLYEFWRRAKVYALTDQRVLIRKGRLSKTEQNLPIRYVQDAKMTHSLGIGGVEVSTAGGAPASLSKMHSLKTSEARQLADAILAQARAAHDAPGSGETTEGDVYDELRKVGELHDSGVLTDEEFDAKKAEILGRREDVESPSADLNAGDENDG